MNANNSWGDEDGASEAQTKTYIDIKTGRINDSKFICGFYWKANEGDVGASKVEIVDRDTKEVKKTFYAFVKEKLSNVTIENVVFRDIDIPEKKIKFTSLNITIKSKTGKEVVLSMGASSNFAQDFLKKLPNIDLKGTINLKPYDFDDKETKRRVAGITIEQDEKKIVSFFDEFDSEGKRTGKALNGFPVAKTKEELSELTEPRRKAYWQGFFTEGDLFLREYHEEHTCSQFTQAPVNMPDVADGDEEW